MTARAVLLVAAATGLVSCALFPADYKAYKAYEGPEIPSPALAVIRTRPDNVFSVYLSQVQRGEKLIYVEGTGRNVPWLQVSLRPDTYDIVLMGRCTTKFVHSRRT
jgi:hypothetical protein